MDGNFLRRRRQAAEPLAENLAVASNSAVFDYAKGDWGDRLRASDRQRNFAYAGAGAAMLLALAMAGVAFKAAQPRIETVVVEVGALGDAVSTAVAPVVRPVDPLVARYQIAEFVRNLRSVSSDPAGEKRNVDALFAMLLQPSPAAASIAEWFGEGDNRPLVRAAKEVVSVEIQTVTVVGPQDLGDKRLDGGNTWRVEWIETARGRQDGRQHYRRTYVATLVTATNVPSSVEAAKANPTGLFVQELSVSERGGRANE